MESKYIQIYKNLSSGAQRMVELLALIFEPIESFSFYHFYGRFISRIPESKLKDWIFEATEKGLIEENYYHIQLRTPCLYAIMADAFKKPTNKIILDKIILHLDWQLSPNNIRKEPSRIFRNLLVGYAFSDDKLFHDSLKKILLYNRLLTDHLVSLWGAEDFNDLWTVLPPGHTLTALLQIRQEALVNLENVTKITQTAERIIQGPSAEKKPEAEFHGLILADTIRTGNFRSISPDEMGGVTGILHWNRFYHLLFQHQFRSAIEEFEADLSFLRKNSGNNKLLPAPIHLCYYFLALLTAGKRKSSAFNTRLLKIIEKTKGLSYSLSCILIYYVNDQLFEAKQAFSDLKENDPERMCPVDQFQFLLIEFILENKISGKNLPVGRKLLDKCLDNEYRLLALELVWMLSVSFEDITFETRLNNLAGEMGIKPLLSFIKEKSNWELTLESLLNIGSGGKIASQDDKTGQHRIVYHADFDHHHIHPLIQTRTSGGWTKGKSIALSKFKSQEAEGFTEQDRRISATIRQEKEYPYTYKFDLSKLVVELVGHPHIYYLHNPGIKIELTRKRPQLFVEKHPEGYLFSCDIQNTSTKVSLIKESLYHYYVVDLTEEQHAILRTLATGKVVIPESGFEILQKTLAHLSSFMTVHSEMETPESDLKQVMADSRIRVQLVPVGESLKAECFVKPFGMQPPWCKPAAGGISVIGKINGETCVAARDLATEAGNLRELSAAVLKNTGFDLSERSVIFRDPSDCLSLLETIFQHQDIAVAEWPAGEKYRLKSAIHSGQFNLSVKSKGHWFELEGEVKTDEGMVLTLQQLLELSTKTRSRFVEMTDGQYIALSEEFKKRLDEINAFAQPDKSGIRMNRFAAKVLEEISGSAGLFQADQKWEDFLKKIDAVAEKEFEIPSILQAELRPYQREGFIWMARLAEWGAGACLADDMGLGKTVQAISLLLYRADIGPSLVVCPVSVVSNWITEINRFAPDLNICVLGLSNRDETFGRLGASDILIISYGILQSEIEKISAIQWNVTVLDEAHVIKNEQTKTSKAAMTLQSGFRLILTGTPVQNHLGELWNLFNFINPGLLGTTHHFNEHFVIPVEKNGITAPKNLLKKLIAPFILRRTKNSVIEDLPPKTDITLKVELSSEETAFYEALRRQAILNIENADEPAGTRHLKALAEITRLRLASCNIKLVDETLAIPSSKLEAFLTVVDELIENNHRALVFSQFLGHLAIVREALEARNIAYQYLDGSTPVFDRQGIVKEFQSGKGKLFLISLKAGGLGLNLTGADYVIHLDPWWNPAVEDQASDRAHRIGQSRPVTIYRLVAANTIEEKILQLHASKRDMADMLLEGTDQAGKLSTKDLLDLLKGSMI